MSRIHIISEISEISPSLAGLPASVPYQVPPAYFETLPEVILRCVQDDPVFITLPNDARKIPFTVPPAYFDDFAGTVLARIRNAESLPAREEIAQLSPLLGSLSKKSPFQVPENYFATHAVPHGAVADDVPAALQSIRNKATYQVPAGYFGQLPQAVLQKVAPAEAVVVSMNVQRRWLRYVAAACMAAVVAVSGWFYFQLHTNPSANGSELAYIKNMSSSELQKFVDQNTVILPETSAVTATASSDIKADDLRLMLTGVSDEELQQYLDQHPQNTDPGSDNFN